MTGDKRREGLEQRLEALTEEYSDLSTALANETNAVIKAKFKRQLKGVEKEMDDIEKKLERSSSQLESRLHEIDFKLLEQIIREILTNHQEEGCAALLLFQNSARMGGEWCAARIRELLRRMTLEGQFRHIPVEFQPGGRADSMALLRRLGQDYGIEPGGQDLTDFLPLVVQKLCGSLQNGSVVMIECRRCDYLKRDPDLFRWVLRDFWERVVQDLKTVAQDYDEIKVIMLLFVDGVLPQDCLPAEHCCQREQFRKDRLLEIPLESWNRQNIREWIARYSGRSLWRSEIDSMADTIYESTNGDPTLVAHALLRECCPAVAG